MYSYRTVTVLAITQRRYLLRQIFQPLVPPVYLALKRDLAFANSSNTLDASEGSFKNK